ncbi:MAG: hypothetical protein AUG51_10905 [Acidobacteria bacterium 13_1_20CM_3_53_8]|nr:MAG: hypothetical protein AUG51_10905 [Acidobacteria bacterium 13_1_20CM_3_53_8]
MQFDFLFPPKHFRALLCLAAALIVGCGALRPAQAQQFSNFDRDRGKVMLNQIRNDLRSNYYDPNFHGMDVEARFKAAEDRIKQATSNNQIFGIIAQLLADLHDSHTFFIPPSRAVTIEYGWKMQAIGDACIVTAIKPGSDAEAKGLKVGDTVLAMDNYQPTRENLWVLDYLYYSLKPQAGMHVAVQSPGAGPREFDIMANVKQVRRVQDLTNGSDIWDVIREAQNEDRLYRQRYIEAGDDLMIWKMPQFDMDRNEVDNFMNKVRKHKALILDLRGNGGGAEETLLRLLGNFFDHDIKIGDVKRRRDTKPLVAKTRGSDIFKGQIVVLIDSQSGSASELFARVIQLEHRGTVIGDHSAGAVMQSRQYSHQVGGMEVVAFYGVSITEADLIMTDGKSLENVGVTPDELLLPTPADLAAQRDPVLAHAAELVGVKLDPARAGAFFPVEWRR